MIKSRYFLIVLCHHASFSPYFSTYLELCKQGAEASHRARSWDSVQGPWSNAKEWEMEDRKSKRGRDYRMRKLTEGDGGSWVNLSSKSSQNRPVPISASPRQESFSPWPCLLLCLWRKDGARLSMIGDGHYLNTISEPGPTPQTIAVRLETTLMRKMMGQSVTLSPFINSDKMFSTQFQNAVPIDFYTMCLSVPLSIRPSYPSLLAHHTLVLFDTHAIPGALQCLYCICFTAAMAELF